MRSILLLLVILAITACAAPNYLGGKGGVPFHDDPDIKLVEGIIQLKYFAVEEALREGADVNALHDLSKSIPRFWANYEGIKQHYTPLGALLRTSRSSQLNKRLYEEEQYTEILNLLLQYGLDPNSSLGKTKHGQVSIKAFSEYNYLRGPSINIGIPLLYENGLILNESLFQTRSFNQTELKILRNKQPVFWSEINDRFNDVLTNQLNIKRRNALRN